MKKTSRKFRIRIKKILFVAVFVILFYSVINAALFFAERFGWIGLTGEDDRILNLQPSRARVYREFSQGDRAFWELTDPGMVPARFPKEKESHTTRIMITGSSFAKGDPYIPFSKGDFDPPGDIAAWIKADLESRYPSRKFEVINAGSTGATSNLVAKIVKDLCAGSPDIFIVISGNNEGFLPATRLNSRLHRWAVYRAMKKVLKKPPKPEDRPDFYPQDPDQEGVKDNYRDNLLQIIEACKKQSVRLALGTLPINYRYDAFQFQNTRQWPPLIKQDEYLRQGIEAMDRGDFSGAIDILMKSETKPIAYAFAAVCYEALGYPSFAKELYKLNLQLSPHGRARPAFNALVRDLCRENGLLLLDLEKRIEDKSPIGISPVELFVDHCHMHWLGYFLCARQIADDLVAAGLIPANEGEPGPALGMQEIIDQNGWNEYLTVESMKSVMRHSAEESQ